MEGYEPSEYDQFLSSKPVNLNAPGTRFSDVYYSSDNSSVEVVESTFNWSQKISLQTKDFGGSAQITMPMSQFLSQCILRLKLPAIVANQTLVRGWGLRCISNIQYQLGSASTTPIVLTGEGIFQFLMSQCESSVKRSQLLDLCGQQWSAPAVVPVGQAAPLVEAYVPLPLPFSALCDKLPLDSTLLAQPVVVQIQFDFAASIYGGDGARPSGFEIAEVLLRQQALADASKSLKNIMYERPTLMYSYPMILAVEHAVPGSFTGSKSNAAPNVVSFNAFQNADLLGLSFRVVQKSDYAATGNNTPNPWHCAEIRDVQVKYNGGMLAQYPGNSLVAVSSYTPNQESAGFDGSYVSAGTVQPFLSTPTQENICYLDFTRRRAACLGDHMDNTWRIPPGGQLEVSFTTPRDDVEYICRYTAYYNAIVSLRYGSVSIMTS